MWFWKFHYQSQIETDLKVNRWLWSGSAHGNWLHKSVSIRKKIKIWIFYSLSINLSGTHFYAPYQMQCFGSIFNVITFHSNNKVVLNKKIFPFPWLKKYLSFFFIFFSLNYLAIAKFGLWKIHLVDYEFADFHFLVEFKFYECDFGFRPQLYIPFFQIRNIDFRKNAKGCRWENTDVTILRVTLIYFLSKKYQLPNLYFGAYFFCYR